METSTQTPSQYAHHRLTYDIIGAAMEVHRTLGPGLLESAYTRCLVYELERRGISVEREKPISVRYKEMEVVNAFRADLVVEGKILIEVKAIDAIVPIHITQTLTNLRLSGLQVGLIFNFHAANLRNGIKRLIV